MVSGDDLILNTRRGSITLYDTKAANVNGEFIGDLAGVNFDSDTTIDGSDEEGVYNYGSNVLINGDYADDTIYNYDSDVSINAGDGDDWIITVGAGKITLEGAASFTPIITRTLKLTNVSSGKVTLPASYIAAEATSRTTAIQITGNALDNTLAGGAGSDTISGGAGDDTLIGDNGNDYLSGGSGDDYVLGGAGNDKLYGYTGDDTLIGGKGNDSLWGQDGADTFIYNAGDGKDMIFGFDDTDMLEINGDWSAAYYSGSGRVVFKVGSTYSAIILDKPTATNFNVNGNNYVVSGNTLARQ